jgi:hypothetical protein
VAVQGPHVACGLLRHFQLLLLRWDLLLESNLASLLPPDVSGRLVQR